MDNMELSFDTQLIRPYKGELVNLLVSVEEREELCCRGNRPPPWCRAFAAVSPYRATRNECRSMVGEIKFIEIFVNTPLDVCEQRDAKGMYAKARRGGIEDFTGIDDPHEKPANAELILTTIDCSAEDNAQRIVRFLIDKAFLLDEEDDRNFV